MSEQRIAVAYGGGVNSTAMIVEMRRRKIKPAWILFADTGGERPETYTAVEAVSLWCVNHGFPPITIVKEPGKTLEQDCLDRRALPSIAYGFKSCSDRWKRRPQNRFMKEVLEHGEIITRAVGFDVGEERRVKISDDPWAINWFPLIEWGLWREDCERICDSAGLPSVKSSCYFCPSMKKHEILRLKAEHPELMERAFQMERNAELTTVKGLGRTFSWENLIRADESQLKMFGDPSTQIPCDCYDG